MAGEKMMRVTLVKSIASTKQDHRATVRGLGLKWTQPHGRRRSIRRRRAA